MANNLLTYVVRQVRRRIDGPGDADRTDGELLQRFASQRDERAFALLVRRHGPLVLRVCRRVLHDTHAAEDAFQAVFLVLARKAGAIRQGESVGGWLYEVAYHVSLRARAGAVRRAQVERRSEPMTATERTPEADRHELCQVLHEELHRLPRKYRTSLVLCYLQGKSNAEAAQELGFPPGSMSRHLARARDLLRDRLLGRGVALPAGLLVTLLTDELATAVLPAVLTETTVEAALLYATGEAASVVGISTQALTLAEGVMNTMTTTTWKMAGFLLLLVGVFGLGSGVLIHPGASAQVPVARAEAPQAAEAKHIDQYGDPLPPGAVARMGTVRWRHPGIFFVACLPDERGVITASSDGTVRLWDVKTGKEIRRFEKEKSPLAAELKDAADQADKLTDGAVKGMMRMMMGAGGWSADGVTALAVSADGKSLALAGPTGIVYRWEVNSGKPLPVLKPEAVGPVGHMIYSPDGQRLAVQRGVGMGLICLYDLATGKEIRRFGKEPQAKNAEDKETGLVVSSDAIEMAFAADGKTLIVRETELKDTEFCHSLHLFRVATGERLASHKLPDNDAANNHTLSPGGRLLAWANLEASSVHIWDVAANREVRRIDNVRLKEALTALTFAPDSKTLVAQSDQGVIVLWDVATGQEKDRFGEARPPVNGGNVGFTYLTANQGTTLAFAPDGKTLVSGGRDNMVRLWDLAAHKERTPVGGHQASVLCLALSPDGKTLWTRGRDHTLRQWEPTTGKEVRRLPLPSGTTCTAFAPDGKMLALADDGGVRLRDVAADQEIRRLEGKANVSELAFSPDGALVAGMLDRRTIQLWDVHTGKQLSVLRKPGEAGDDNFTFAFPFTGTMAAPTMAFAPDGRVLAMANPKSGFRVVLNGGGAVAEEDDAIHLWDVGSGKPVAKLETDNVAAIAFSPDGRVLAAAHHDQTVSLWELASGKQRARLKGSSKVGSPAVVAFSPDGKTLSVGGSDRSVCFWDVATGKEFGHFDGHQGPVGALVFAADGRTVVSGSNDTTAIVWDMTGLQKPETPKLKDVPVPERDALWADLASVDAAQAYQAIRSLSQTRQAAALVRERVQPAAAVERQRLDQLVADLNGERFEVREKATAELQRLGDLAVPALKRVLDSRPPLETQQRIEQLLDTILVRRTLTAEQLQALRAVEVLEASGSAQSRAVLEALAGGAAEARLTREAQAALRRLGPR